MGNTRPGPLTAVTAAVRAGAVRAEDVVTLAVDRLEATSDTLNVFLEADFEGALRQAQALDRGGSAKGALSGAPLLIKDLEDWRGHPTRKGSLALRDVAPAASDGVVPQRLQAAGAIVLAKSTLPEFAIEGFCANELTGVTCNPWNLAYSPGGSSGGSAAALAAGLVLIGTATDGGGSVRIPASLCGLVGLKPTNGMIGRWPAPDWIDYSTDGPFATSSDDLRLLFTTMRGPVPGDPTAPSTDAHRSLDQPRAPARIIAADRTSPLGPLPAGVASAFHQSVEAFAALYGLGVEWRDPDAFFTSGDPDLDWFTVCAAEHVSSLGRDWVLEHMGDFHVATREFLSAGLAVSLDEYLAARRRRYQYVRTMDELLENDTVLLTPTVASEGWLADGRLDESSEVHGLPPTVYSTALQNTTGHPALTVPMGALSTGLPFGLQVTTARYRDCDLLTIADRVQAAYPWPRCAPGYTSMDEALDL